MLRPNKTRDTMVKIGELEANICHDMKELNLNIDDWNKIYCLLQEVICIIKKGK